MSCLVQELCLLLSIDRVHTIAYHPQSNEMLEHMHNTLEAMLAKVLKGSWLVPSSPIYSIHSQTGTIEIHWV